MLESSITRAIETLSAKWLGRQGVVSVADVYEPDGPALLILVDGDVEAVRRQVPEKAEGFPVRVRKSGPIVRHSRTG